MSAAAPGHFDMPDIRWFLAAAWLLLGAWAWPLRAASNAIPRATASFAIKVWETDDDLPGSAVITMTQTRDGYLWLGTLNGLVRFDGIRFHVFDESNTPGLNSSRIVSLFEDSQGVLWVGTETAGTVLVKDGQVVRPPELALGGAERRLMSACEGADGAVWLYSANGELWRCKGGTFSPFLVGQNEPSVCRTIIAERGGSVWVGTDRRQFSIGAGAGDGSLALPVTVEVPAGKLDLLLASRRGGYWRLADGRIQKWTTNRLERDLGEYRWGGAPVLAACEDHEGNLLVGTLGAGVFWFDAQGQATALSTNEGLSHNYVLSLVVDREGTLWVGTDGRGLNRVKRQVFEVLEPSRGMVVQSACADDEGALWFGSNGNGAGRWKDGIFEPFGPAQGLMNLYVRTMFVDRSNRVWAGTYGAGLFQFQDGRFQRVAGGGAIHPVVQAIHQDRAGQLWLGTLGGLVRWDGTEWKSFTIRDGLSADGVRTIADDADGNLWIGTVGGGLSRLRDGRFTVFRKQADGLPSDDISSLWVDAEGVLWIGTFGSGLVRFHDGKWTRYTEREGLVSNGVGYLLEDGRGNLWIGSNKGLMRVPKKALNELAEGRTTFIPCRAFQKPDGLPTRECTLGSQPGAWRDRNGQAWFPTIKGLAFADLAQLTLNSNPPPVAIESVLIDGREQNRRVLRADWSQPVTVPAAREWLEIHFTSLNLSSPDRARFKYRLEGHETAWFEAGSTRFARYSKLPPGDYRFQVTACNEDGVWNDIGSSLAIVVLPPFWRTWWFLTGSAAGLLGLVIVVVHYFSTQKLQRQLEGMRQKEALEQERARIARDLHDQLGANLTQVSLLGEMVESDKELPGEVESHARQISQTARETARALDEIVWAANPANDTLEGLINYACKYAQEYLALAGVRYRLEVPPQLPVVVIPPDLRHNVFLAFKEAVNNLVKHAQASSARVCLKLEPSAFTLEIEDNGRGLSGLGEPRAQTRNGLRNMRKRMEDVGGSFSIGPGSEGGTRVCLKAPMGNH